MGCVAKVTNGNILSDANPLLALPLRSKKSFTFINTSYGIPY